MNFEEWQRIGKADVRVIRVHDGVEIIARSVFYMVERLPRARVVTDAEVASAMADLSARLSAHLEQASKDKE